MKEKFIKWWWKFWKWVDDHTPPGDSFDPPGYRYIPDPQSIDADKR